MDTRCATSPGNCTRNTPARSCRRARDRATARRARCRARAATSWPARAMSSTATRETCSRRGGRSRDRSTTGQDEPNGLPSELMHMTKKRRVSIGLPGADHRFPPARLRIGSRDEAAWADGERPVKITIALSCARPGRPRFHTRPRRSATRRRGASGTAVAVSGFFGRLPWRCQSNPFAGVLSSQLGMPICPLSASRASVSACASAPGAA